MNKKDVIAKVAEKMEITKKAAGEHMDAMLEVIIEAMVAGEDVKISGFGTFSAVEVSERTGTIQMGDRKGETYVTPAHRAPKFKAASALKEAVR
jgi:DNA-binding protein HU-beta